MSTQPLQARSKVTLQDLRKSRQGSAPPMAMLTCYDYTTATHMRAAGVPALLVGDSAASVILGHPTTLPVSLEFLIEITAAVRRGHPDCLLVADMPFGSYHASAEQGVLNVVKMVQQTNCDAVKLEVSEAHLEVIRRLADAGVAVIAHIGLRPQAVGLLGGYRAQGRTAGEAEALVDFALSCQNAGAAALLLEAVPSETALKVVEATSIPILGCGAGPHVHGHVVVTQDLLGLTPPPPETPNAAPRRPKFVPTDTDLTPVFRAAFSKWVQDVSTHAYPAPAHEYAMASPPAAPASTKR